MRTKTCLTLADANTIMAAAKAAAITQGWAVSIAVVDETGRPLHLERMDGTSLNSLEIGTLKASTAALMRRSTKDIEDLAKTRNTLLAIPNLLPVQGGLPILVEGACVGAVGVSGMQSHQDEEIARAGIAALGLG